LACFLDFLLGARPEETEQVVGVPVLFLNVFAVSRGYQVGEPILTVPAVEKKKLRIGVRLYAAGGRKREGERDLRNAGPSPPSLTFFIQAKRKKKIIGLRTTSVYLKQLKLAK